MLEPRTLTIAVLIALLAAPPPPTARAAVQDAEPTAALGRFGQAGPFAVDSRLEEWHDAKRARDLPVKFWFPRAPRLASPTTPPESSNPAAGAAHASANADRAGPPFPVVLFSHGLGGTRENYAYFGQHVASHGYVVVHLQHPGSDDAAWRGQARPLESMRRATTDLENLLGRPADVSFAIDQLERLDADDQWPLHDQVDLAAIAVAGHSFGAYTALCAAGRVLVPPIGRPREVGDVRVKACIALSSPAAERDRTSGAYDRITVPCLHFTGTRDDSPIGDTPAVLRRLPFDASPHAERVLVILQDADHGAFGDSRRGDRHRDPAHHPLILAASTAFLAATLQDDAAARTWLLDGGYAAALGARGTFEWRLPQSPAASSGR